mmetsp:Transcript_148618/g.259745  ORF Transcript_148618/g.259745 Transcript_148618/m.259745 type:complete len:208 (+) Transcript_148618:506-1129(+)
MEADLLHHVTDVPPNSLECLIGKVLPLNEIPHGGHLGPALLVQEGLGHGGQLVLQGQSDRHRACRPLDSLDGDVHLPILLVPQLKDAVRRVAEHHPALVGVQGLGNDDVQVHGRRPQITPGDPPQWFQGGLRQIAGSDGHGEGAVVLGHHEQVKGQGQRLGPTPDSGHLRRGTGLGVGDGVQLGLSHLDPQGLQGLLERLCKPVHPD